MQFPYVFRWKNNKVRKKYFNKRCRVLARGSMNSILLEFENGDQITTSGNAIRKVKEADESNSD